MKIFIRPVDVWLFRDGRPFDAGGDHRARSVFPPSPTVIQGVIRSHHVELNGGLAAYLNHQLPEVERFVGAPGKMPPSAFRLRGHFVAGLCSNGECEERRVNFYFPMPSDAFLYGDIYRPLKMHKPDEEVFTDLDGLGFELLWPEGDFEPGKAKSEEGGLWVSLAAMQDYLAKGQISRQEMKRGSDLFVRESRVGIGRDDFSRANRDSLLYEADFIRPCEGFGLFVEVEGLPEWPKMGVMAIGGEARAGYYKAVKAPGIVHQLSPDTKKFKVIFLTPTYFRRGWQPDNWESLIGAGVKFLGAAVGQPLVLGGFSQADKRHKPARRYVPAGSVYYFTGKPPVNIEAITEYGANIGFGQFIMGGW